MNSLEKFEKQQGKVKFDKKFLEYLSKPKKIKKVNLPLKRDSGKIEIFEGYRVQYSSILGPYKGGLRYHPTVSLKDIEHLGFLMTLKCALFNLPFGGSKGGIKVNPSELSPKELEQLTRIYTRKIADVIGPHKDIPAPDVGTNSKVMSWIYDEYSKIVGKKMPAVVTGKPENIGGLKLRQTSTALGGAYILGKVLEKLKLKQKSISVAIQGFGNVGANLALILYSKKFLIQAISDSKCGLFHKDALDIEKQYESKIKNKIICKDCYCAGNNCQLKQCKILKNQEILELPVDVLIPAALEQQITERNASKIKAKIILEMANHAITEEAERILIKKGILVIPDILANGGGATVSYFEWLKNLNRGIENENHEFKKKTVKAFDEVWNASVKYKFDLRTASFYVALKRLEKKFHKI